MPWGQYLDRAGVGTTATATCALEALGDLTADSTVARMPLATADLLDAMNCQM